MMYQSLYASISYTLLYLIYQTIAWLLIAYHMLGTFRYVIVQMYFLYKFMTI